MSWLAEVTPPLTFVSTRYGRRGWLSLPKKHSFLVFRGSEEGPVVAEVGLYDSSRTLSLSQGHYFVRGRARDHLLEGQVAVRAGSSVHVERSHLQRVAYARLVRKGGSQVKRSHSLGLGYFGRSAIRDGAGWCHGMVGHYDLHLAAYGLGVDLRACRNGFSNPALVATNDELSALFRVSPAWDVGPLTVSAGVAGGVALLYQRFESERDVAPRLSPAGILEPSASLQFPFAGGFVAALRIGAAIYAFNHTDSLETSLKLAPALTSQLSLAREF